MGLFLARRVYVFDPVVCNTANETQEERDYHLGRLFGSEAVIQSKILFQSTVEIDQWQRVLDIVYQLARKKSWLREQCGWVLTKVLRALQLQEDGIQYAQILLERLCVHGLAGGPEGVAIWMIASKLFPKIPKPLGVWHCQDPLSRVQELKRAFTPQGSLTKEMQENSAHLAQNGSWNSKPHFAWDVVLGTLLENGAPNLPDGPQQITFQDFWAESVDSMDSSRRNNRSYHANHLQTLCLRWPRPMNENTGDSKFLSGTSKTLQKNAFRQYVARTTFDVSFIRSHMTNRTFTK